MNLIEDTAAGFESGNHNLIPCQIHFGMNLIEDTEWSENHYLIPC